MYYKRFLAIFLLLFLALECLEIELLNDETKVYQPGKLINLDFKLKNLEKSDCEVKISIVDNEDFKPLFSNRSFIIKSNEEKIVTYFVKIAEKKPSGKSMIACFFESSQNKISINFPINIAKVTKVALNNYFFENKNVTLEIQNDSNHPVTVREKKIPPFSSERIPFTFQEEIIPGHYKGTIEIYSEKECVQKFYLGASTIKYNSPKPLDEEFIFPINYGTAFSNNKSDNSLTFYTNGGGYFSENQNLNFNFSIPFFHKNDPYLYYNPEAAIFYLDYKFKDWNIRIGDSFYKNNPTLFYSYGRGYSLEYSKNDGFFGNIAYITSNTFYPNQDKTLLLSLGNHGSKSLYYQSSYDFSNYNQNLGFSYISNPKLKGKIEIYNTDFKINQSHLGALGEFNLKIDNHSADFHLDYLGDHFKGRINSELKVLANYSLRSSQKNEGFFISGSYFDIFPLSKNHSHTIEAKAGFNKFYQNNSHRITLDFSNYHSLDLLRNNLSFYYSLNQKITPSTFLQLDQGLTYATLSPNQHKEGIRSYTNIITSFRKGSWSFSMGAKSQMRFFSDTLQPENAIYFQTGFESNRTNLSTSFNFSNSTFKYRPSVNFHLVTGFKAMDLQLDYQLIPTFSGFDYRGLFRINFLNYLHLKKPKKIVTHFYDSNTNKLINNLTAKTKQDRVIPISSGSSTVQLTHEELENLEFSSYKIQRKKNRLSKINIIEDHFTFHVDFRGVIEGKFKFLTDKPRKSLEQLVLNQTIVAIDEEGAYHLGTIRNDGSFSINRLKLGTYKVVISSDELPDVVKIKQIEAAIDYHTPLQNIELTVNY